MIRFDRLGCSRDRYRSQIHRHDRASIKVIRRNSDGSASGALWPLVDMPLKRIRSVRAL